MTRLEAASKAKALRDGLGIGWRSRVWENLGWHCAVENGVLKIHPSSSGYTVLIGEEESVGGRWVGHGRTVRGAVRKAIAACRAEIERKNVLLEKAVALQP